MSLLSAQWASHDAEPNSYGFAAVQLASYHARQGKVGEVKAGTTRH